MINYETSVAHQKMLTNMINQLRETRIGNKSFSRKTIHTILESEEITKAVVQIALDSVADGINKSRPLTNILRGVGHKTLRLLDIKDHDDHDCDELECADRVIKLGSIITTIMVDLKLVSVIKHMMLDNDAKQQYFLTCIDDTLMEYITTQQTSPLRANQGFTEWTSPIMRIGDNRIDIVKKARSHKMLSSYRYSEMPEVYNVLNKMGRTRWCVNQEMLTVLDREPAGTLIPEPITDEARRAALARIHSNQQGARSLASLTFAEFESHDYPVMTEVEARKTAEKEAAYYLLRHNKDYLKIISAWSKERDFRKCVAIASDYKYDSLHFLYNRDSRGRAYVFNQGFLQPQGADHAKALLLFADPKPISTYDFQIATANHAGRDKVSFDDRIEWFTNNSQMIYEVGKNPWSAESMKWLIDTGIAAKRKSKFQFIACAIEWGRLCDFCGGGGDQETFLSGIPVAFDGTNSGLQILSAIGRDGDVAPYVNIENTDKPGDIYQRVGTAVAKKKPVERMEAIPAESSIWRDVVKRNVMCKNYDATRFGMGDMQWQDLPLRQDDQSDGIWSSMTFQECLTMGQSVYDTCSEYLPAAHKLMTAMKRAIKHNKNALVKWKLPNGFTAFQEKHHSDKRLSDIKLGGTRYQLVYYESNNRPNRAKHSSAIAADITHSIDAWLLSMIVENMPENANLSFIHDSFGSDSIHGADIQETARKAYFNASSRVIMEGILRNVSGGVKIELPEPGTWDRNEILQAEYIVC